MASFTHKLSVPAFLGIALFAAGTRATAPQKTQESQEQLSFVAARAQTDPEARAAALQAFLSLYPASSRQPAAEELLLEVLLRNFPERTAAIHTTASALIASSSPGMERWTEAAILADQLADAGEHGADLADAAAWGSQAMAGMTEAAYRLQVQRLQARYKLPALGPKQLRAQFAYDRAAVVSALANVRLQQGDLAQASPLVSEALHLDPLSGKANRVQAALALHDDDRSRALTLLLRADALSPLPPTLRAAEVDLFHQQRGGDAAALDTAIDATYRTLYPVPFRLPHRQLEAGGHPALLELFTGSDCAPCAAPDLAVDGLLDSYSRQDLIALEFDEHVPRPDPLANTDTEARANYYDVASTPTAFLDGQPIAIPGASRQDVEPVTLAFADVIESQASRPSGLRLSVVTTRETDNIAVRIGAAQVSVPARERFEATGDGTLHSLMQSQVFVALVQDNLRYPGKNGIRFHRMVVRAMQQRPLASLLPSASQSSTVSFSLAALEGTQATYLAAYETHNSRFGAFHFPEVNLKFTPDSLKVVVWVQNPATKEVLQSAFAMVPAP